MGEVKFCSGSPFCDVCGGAHPEGWVQNCPTPLKRHPHLHTKTAPPNRGLGTLLRVGLLKIGVTHHRYLRLKKLLRLAPRCNCKKREEWLNRHGKLVVVFLLLIICILIGVFLL